MPFPRFSRDELEQWLICEAIAERYELERRSAHAETAATAAAQDEARRLVDEMRGR